MTTRLHRKTKNQLCYCPGYSCCGRCYRSLVPENATMCSVTGSVRQDPGCSVGSSDSGSLRRKSRPGRGLQGHREGSAASSLTIAGGMHSWGCWSSPAVPRVHPQLLGMRRSAQGSWLISVGRRVEERRVQDRRTDGQTSRKAPVLCDTGLQGTAITFAALHFLEASHQVQPHPQGGGHTV